MSKSRFKPVFTWRSAICKSTLTSTERHVALVVSLHFNEMGESCFPSLALLAEETALKTRTVSQCLKVLEAEGWLEREFDRSQKGRGTIVYYTMTTPSAERSETTGGPADDDATTCTSTHDHLQSDDTTTYSQTVAPIEEEGDMRATGGRQSSPAAKKERPRNEIFDALAVACGLDLGEMTTAAAKECGVASSDLRRVGATPAEIERRVAHYRLRFPGMSVTPSAIAKHWPKLGSRPLPEVPAHRSAPGMDAIRARRAEREGRPSVLDVESLEVT